MLIKLRRISIIIILLLSTAFPTKQLCANSNDEYKVKMLLTYNLSRYTYWPKNIAQENFNFCILDNVQLAEVFLALKDKTLKNRKITITSVSSKQGKLGELTNCQVLYIDSKDRNTIALALAEVSESPTLTIGQLPDFIDHGGIINLYWQEKKIRFAISTKATKRASLKISANVLELAKIID